MKLSNRLKKISDLIPKNSKVGDIGTDHGFLAAYLIEKNIAKYCIASDLNKGPILNAKTTVHKYGYENKIDVRLGSGIEPYKLGEIDVAVIAGMGGILISEILAKRLEFARKLKFLILQPMIGQSELRKWLCANNFKIINEEVAIEGNKIYEIILVTSGEMKIENDFLYEIGPILFTKKDRETIQFFNMKLKKYLKIKNSLIENSKKIDKDYYNGVLNKIKILEELLLCL